MNNILIAIIVISLFIFIINIIEKKKKILILILSGIVFLISNIILFGISFSPKSSLLISNCFMYDYISEYKIDDKNTVVIGKKNDSYFMYKSKKILGFIYVKNISKINKMYLYPKTYGLNDDDSYFYNIEYIQINDKYLFLIKENGNMNDIILFNDENVSVIQSNIDKFILFMASSLPDKVKYNNVEMNVLYRN